MEVAQRRNPVQAGDGRMERQRIGQDGRRHARGLDAVRLMQDACDPSEGVGVEVEGVLAQPVRRDPDAVLQYFHPPGDPGLRQGDEFDRPGDIVDAAPKPIGIGPAVRFARRGRQDTVSELRRRDPCGQVILEVLQLRRDL